MMQETGHILYFLVSLYSTKFREHHMLPYDAICYDFTLLNKFDKCREKLEAGQLHKLIS